MPDQVLLPCEAWANNMNTSMNTGMGFTAAGEFSNAINDCGLWVNGVGLGSRYDGTFTGFAGKGAGSCSVYVGFETPGVRALDLICFLFRWTDYKNWTNATREGIREFNLASMDALQVRFTFVWWISLSSDI